MEVAGEGERRKRVRDMQERKIKEQETVIEYETRQKARRLCQQENGKKRKNKVEEEKREKLTITGGRKDRKGKKRYGV